MAKARSKPGRHNRAVGRQRRAGSKANRKYDDFPVEDNVKERKAPSYAFAESFRVYQTCLKLQVGQSFFVPGAFRPSSGERDQELSTTEFNAAYNAHERVRKASDRARSEIEEDTGHRPRFRIRRDAMNNKSGCRVWRVE